MKIGTKTILFGTHQFLLHPIFVFIAWLILYRKLPGLHEFCAIVTHDLGYWGCADIDGDEGTKHPQVMANIWDPGMWGETKTWFRHRVAFEIVGHSRFYAGECGMDLSKLFYADKLAVSIYPMWLYLLLANLSGEIKEYMSHEKYDGEATRYVRFGLLNQVRWLIEVRSKMALMGLNNYGNSSQDIHNSLKNEGDK